jgi:putative tricarboxylic transport membrane protein
MKENTEERIASIVLVVFSLAYLVGGFLIPMPALKQQVGPGAFPIAIGLGMLILAGIYAWQQFRGPATAEVDEAEIEARAAIIGAEEKIEKKADLRTMGFILLLMVCYAFLFEILGYAISTFLMFMSGVLYLDRRHLIRDSVIAIIASFFLYYVFTILLRVQLPAGPLKFLAY